MSRHRRSPFVDDIWVSVLLFLLTVSIGIAVDISVRAGGLLVPWVFAVAFFTFSPYMERNREVP